MCDTLVALGNSTKDRNIIFGKNSDRPYNEVQLITYNPRTIHSKGEELKCTYISIPQVSETYAVLLSQPWWMWGQKWVLMNVVLRLGMKPYILMNR